MKNLFFCLLLPVVSFAQPGVLDNTFDSDGIVTTGIGPGADDGGSITIQSDGKILLCGDSHNGSNYDFSIARYNVDGSPDTTFDTDGKVTTAFGSTDDLGRDIVVQPDGKIIQVGYATIGVSYVFAIARHNPNGSLDTTFDVDGKVMTAIGSGTDVIYSVALQPDGKIVVAGVSFNGIDNDFAVARYNNNGSLDSTFDGDGKLTTAIGNSHDVGSSVTIQPDGKIVAAGISNNGINTDFAIVRYETNGALDSSFDADGIVITDFMGFNDVATSVRVQSNNKIVAAGYMSNGSNSDVALARYNANGSLDSTFDTDGKVTTAIGPAGDVGDEIVIQPNGKILVGGYASDGTNNDFAVVRYNANGSPDNSFDSDGIVVTSINTGDDHGSGIALQSDSKIVVGGFTFNGTDNDFAVVRYIGCAATSTTISTTACTAYTVPSGNATHTASGMYMDTITNVEGCDSVLTINLTITGVPVVTLALNPDTACASDGVWMLTGGSPAGGTYSGPGVSSNMFDPSVAGIGTHAITYSYTDVNGCDSFATEQIYVDICLGVANAGASTVQIYPNPTNGIFQVELPEGTANASVEITNALGQVVYYGTISSQNNFVDLSRVAGGMYVVRVIVGENVMVSQLIKE